MNHVPALRNSPVNQRTAVRIRDRVAQSACELFDRVGTVLGGAVLTQQHWLNANPGMRDTVEARDESQH